MIFPGYIKKARIPFVFCMIMLNNINTYSQPTDNEKEKYVGIFYFVWLGQHDAEQQGNYDITRLFENHRQDLFDKEGTPESPKDQYHFWGEPLYGYYNSADPWVITRHIELLTEAGIDYIMIDATNGFYYPNTLFVLLDKLLSFKQKGYHIPQVAFYTNSHSGTTAGNIYEHYYRSGKYDEVWFMPEGKPLIIGITRNNNNASDQLNAPGYHDFISDDLIKYFDVRESQWPTALFNDHAFPWISWEYPQRVQNGVLPVSVAQHSPVNVVFSDTIYAKGRGFDAINKKNNKDLARTGKNFQDQWNTVFRNKDSIYNVFITGWNEWVAIKTVINDKVAFVDAFNEEFSRDVEMMKGGYGDNFYLQMVDNIGCFKGSPVNNYKKAEISIDFNNDNLSQWNTAAHYEDLAGDAIVRNYPDFSGKNNYIDNSARNDITDIKVAHDNQNVYFLIKTEKEIIPHNGKDLNWMNILIQTPNSKNKPFGYDFIINRFPDKQGKSAIEKAESGNKWKKRGTAQYRLHGTYLFVSVPLKTLGMNKENVSFGFKVADNVTNQEDIMDYYISGDSAPIGRLNFHYGNNP